MPNVSRLSHAYSNMQTLLQKFIGVFCIFMGGSGNNYKIQDSGTKIPHSLLKDSGLQHRKCPKLGTINDKNL